MVGPQFRSEPVRPHPDAGGIVQVERLARRLSHGGAHPGDLRRHELRHEPRDDTREHDHEVVIKFDDRQAPSRWQGYMDEVKQGAVDISADVGLSVRYVDWNSVEDYQSSVEFKRIPGNVIGYYYLPQGSGCRRVPQGALDTSYQPDVEMASLLWIHEGLGHGIALQHTNGGIMNPSLIRSPMSWRNDPSWRAIERLYGGEPLDPPAPDPPPTPDKPDVVFTYTAKKSGEKISLVTGTTDGGGGWEF